MQVFDVIENRLDLILPPDLNPIRILDRELNQLQPWRIVVLSIGVVGGLVCLFKLIRLIFTTNWKQTLFRTFRKLPFVESKIQQLQNESLKAMAGDVNVKYKGVPFNRSLPSKGLSKDRVVDNISTLLGLSSFKPENGSLSGTYHKPTKPEASEAMVTAYSMAAFTNVLNLDAFPGVQKMEAEVVRMVIDMFNGDDQACGTMTSGGSESLILACKAYRDFGAASRGITRPNIVMSKSGHCAFDKAGHILGIEIRHVPMDEATWQPKMNKFASYIDSNTIMLVASAPQYPHGVMDPVRKIAAIAVKKNIPLHVDACLGGFLIAFMNEVGYDVGEEFDFRVPGVTSISADTHKFGYAPKGSSVILYKDKKYVHHQYFTVPDWSGGIYASPTIAGSRSGGMVAATWAGMMALGRDGYCQATKELVNTFQAIRDGIANIDGLRILGSPRVCIVAFTSDKFHVYTLASNMKDRGWQLSSLQYPTCVHFYVTPSHTRPGIKERFLNDLQLATAELLKIGKVKLEGSAAIYGMAQTLPDTGLVSEMAVQFLDALYTTKIE